MFKIAYCAGHYLDTPGKRLPAQLDPAQTREWVLNDRVARAFAAAAADYDVALLRTDDETGRSHRSIEKRTAMANAWGADVYLDIHHNAGINCGSGGGVVAFSYPGSAKGSAYRDAIYSAVIAAGGLQGNRSQPLQEKAFDSLRLAKAPAVLLECGFMDSTTDAPVILTQAYANLVGQAAMAAIARAAGLQKKEAAVNPTAVTREVCNVEIQQLKKGAKGASVKAMQQLLQGNGYSCGTTGADGDFGSNTDKALRSYQRDKGLTADGICGSKSWTSLLGG